MEARKRYLALQHTLAIHFILLWVLKNIHGKCLQKKKMK